ncbi:probable G-protein coupled receptor 148 [Acipenser ruthenus]|nr:probable G-protein coupled receptor 148 [Acipenser ruthenus]
MDVPPSLHFLVCSFRSLLINGSITFEKTAGIFNNSHLRSEMLAELMKEWRQHLPLWQMKMLLICPIACFVAVWLVIPLILLAIFSNPRIRQETRYLLLANLLLSDLIYVSLYTLGTCFNAGYVLMSKEACACQLFFLGVSYCAGVLSTKAMVLDISLAVLLPLRYSSLCPVSRTKKVILLTWIFSCILPCVSIIFFMTVQEENICTMNICSLPLLIAHTVNSYKPLRMFHVVSVTGMLMCLGLILGCYIMLYCKTKQSGIWTGFFARAKGTFLIHYILLFLSFCPLLLIVVETLLYSNDLMEIRTGMWVTLTNCNMLMMLPKALTPYLYGFRYKEISKPLKAFYRLKCPRHAVSPVTANPE